MIKTVSLRSIQGISRDVQLFPRTILSGRNGAGKTTAMNAAVFALAGEWPGLPKKDGDIWAAVATDDHMWSEVHGEAHGGSYSVARSLTRTPSSTTKQAGSVNGTDRKKAEMDLAIESAGAKIGILNLASFWSLSEPKQVSELCRYYRGEITAEGINQQFPAYRQDKLAGLTQFEVLDLIADKIKAAKSKATQAGQGADKSIKSISEERDAIERPAGSLAEIQKEIAALEQQAKQIRVNLSQVGEEKAKFAAWKREVETLQAEVAELGKMGLKEVKVYQWDIRQIDDAMAKAKAEPNAQAVEALNRILVALEDSGCAACAVKLAVKKERKQFEGRAPTADAQDMEKDRNKLLALIDKRRTLEMATQRLARLQQDPRSRLMVAEQSESLAAAEGIQAHLEKLRATKEALTRLADLNASIEKIRLGEVKAEKDLEEIKQAEKDLARLRKQITSEIFEPVAAAITAFLSAGKAVVGLDANGKLFIGWQIPGRPGPTPRTLLSGGERAIFDPAMALGLLSLDDDRGQKLLLIEAAEMDQENFKIFCNGLTAAPANVQIIVATWSSPESIHGFEVINLEYQEVAHAA